MKIIYNPFYSRSYYLDMSARNVALDVQVLETQGLLSQLAIMPAFISKSRHIPTGSEIPWYNKKVTQLR